VGVAKCEIVHTSMEIFHYIAKSFESAITLGDARFCPSANPSSAMSDNTNSSAALTGPFAHRC